MSRELKPDLFPDLLLSKSNEDLLGISLSVPVTQKNLLSDENQQYKAQLDLLKRRLKELEIRQEQLQMKSDAGLKKTETRLDRFNHAGSRMELFLKQTIQEINDKFAQMGSRLSERRLHDNKIQEMIDRHNHILQTYEVRLTQVQKLVNEQELQLIAAKAALEDARREISRLKKI